MIKSLQPHYNTLYRGINLQHHIFGKNRKNKSYIYTIATKTFIFLLTESYQAYHATPIYEFYRHKKKESSPQRKDDSYSEPRAGLEPATYALRMRCSTN